MTAATEARDRLRAASYRTGQPQYSDRCETCAHCAPAQRGSRYDRQCALHDARVKTHGLCDWWARRSAQR